MADLDQNDLSQRSLSRAFSSNFNKLKLLIQTVQKDTKTMTMTQVALVI